MLILAGCTLVLLSGTSALSASKLSIHINGVDGTMASWIAATQPQVVKLLDPNSGDVAAVKSASPNTIIIGRIYAPTQPMSGDPVAAAQAWIAASLPTIQACSGVDFWEGYNEPPTDYASLLWYSQFEVARVRGLAAAGGVRAAVGQFSTGTPDVTNATVIAAFLPAIAAAKAANGVLALHEYSSPYMWSCFNNASGSGWLTGRYRMLYEQFLIPANLSLPLVVSENGIDNSPCGSPNTGGWLSYCGFWAAAGYGNDCAATYVSQLAWYDALMRADDYVLGSTLFCYHCSGFDTYEQATALAPLQAYMNALR